MGKKLKHTTKLLPLLLLSFVAVSTAYMAIIASQNLSMQGRLKVVGNIGLYEDLACNVPISSFDWGEFDEAQTKFKYIYIRNKGNTPVTLTWSIAETTWTLDAALQKYEYITSGLRRWVAGQNAIWYPNKPSTSIDPNAVYTVQFYLWEDKAIPAEVVSYTVVIEASA